MVEFVLPFRFQTRPAITLRSR